MSRLQCAIGVSVAVLLACGGGGTASTAAGEATPAESDAAAGTTAPSLDDDALKALREALERNPADVEARRRLAIALHRADHKDEAIEQFELLVERDASARSLLDLALAYSSALRLDDAATTYERLLELSPNHAIALHNLGNLAFKRDQTDRAIELYGKALAAKPDYLLGHFHLGEALELVERYRDAYRSYERVLQLEPTTPGELAIYDDALYRLASLDIKMAAYERAARFLAELLRANPEHPKAYYAYAQVLTHLGRVEEAQRALEIHMRILAKQKPTGPAAHGE